jgi:sialate O-acetylesterase
MARWALKDVYGRKIVNAPVVVRADAKNGKVILSFVDVGSGLRIRDGDKLDEFAIAGDDKKWFWAEAKIIRKNMVEVSSPSVADPKAVRYAFNSNPKHPNLTNASGLPVSPFRTDDWPDPTAGKK